MFLFKSLHGMVLCPQRKNRTTEFQAIFQAISKPLHTLSTLTNNYWLCSLPIQVEDTLMTSLDIRVCLVDGSTF